MKTILAALLCAGLAVGDAGQITPVSKAVELLTDLHKKITAEGEVSAKNYEETAAFCKDTAKDLGFAIQTQTAEVADLQAKIEQESAAISALGQKTQQLSGSIAQNDADLAAATAIREQEAKEFAAEEKELMEIVDTLERAISILRRELAKGSPSLLQGQQAGNIVQALSSLVQASVLSSADASRLTALVQDNQNSGDDAGDNSLQPPAAPIYEHKSDTIIETLEDLLDKARTQLADARKKETNSAHNFELLKQSLTDETKYLTKDMGEAQKSMAESTQDKASAEGDLQVTSKSLSADKETLNAHELDCEQAKKDFEAETASRKEELSAIDSALQSLKDMTPNAEAFSYGLNQASFLQESSHISSYSDLAGFEVVRLIRDLAKKEHTPELAQLASRVAATVRGLAGTGQDPFKEVKGLITDLIARLQAEASAEASHKAYCDEEIAESNAKISEKTADIEKLSAKIDGMSARSTKLKEEVSALQQALAELAARQAEMDKLRKAEHEAFVTNKADLELGMQGVAMALKFLREYFAREDKSHQAAQDAATNIIGLLEVVESDFSKDLATITSTEEAAEAAYVATTKDNDIEKVMKEQDVKYKTKESVSLDKAVAEATSDRSNIQAELDAVNEYLSKLEEQCIAKAETYEARKKRREEEIAGLKEALRVLESETALVQQRSSRQSKRHLKLRGVRF